MQACIEQFARQPEHAVSDCCVVCLLSHGVEGSIYGIDGKLLEVSSFPKLINNSSGIRIQHRICHLDVLNIFAGRNQLAAVWSS